MTEWRLTKCRLCGAPIRFARTVNGKNIPLDPDPVRDGNVYLLNGFAHAMRRKKRAPDGGCVFRAHFNCTRKAGPSR